MKMRIFMAAAMTVIATATMAMSPFQAYVSDDDGPLTNIRCTPNGKLAMTLPTSEVYVFNISNPTNGWWEVDYAYNPVYDTEIQLYGSTTGKYWVHNSVLALSSRNYGNERWCLRKSPKPNAQAVYYFNYETSFHPIDISADGDWVKVTTFDKKHTGWIEIWNLCDNPLTTCP